MLEDFLLYEAQMAVLHWLQSWGGWLVAPMQALSFLGDETFYLLVMPALYWCLSPALGLRAGLLLMLSNGLNTALKLSFALPRPPWYGSLVQGWVSESSFGLPSGHAQNAAALWGLLASQARRAPWQAGLVALIGLIGISRLFLGVHFITDVLAGWLVGGALLWAMLRFEAPVMRAVLARPLPWQVMLVFAASLAMIGAGLLGLVIGSSHPTTPAVLDSALPYVPEGETPLSPETAFTVAGAFFGLAAGALVLQARQVRFTAEGGARVLALRYVAGAVGVLVLWRGLGALLPDDGSLLALTLRYSRYALIGAWISAGAPWLFLRLGWRGPRTVSG